MSCQSEAQLHMKQMVYEKLQRKSQTSCESYALLPTVNHVFSFTSMCYVPFSDPDIWWSEEGQLIGFTMRAIV